MTRRPVPSYLDARRSWRRRRPRAPTPCTPATATSPRAPSSPRRCERGRPALGGAAAGGDARAWRQDRGAAAGRGGRRRRSSPGYAGVDLADADADRRGGDGSASRCWSRPPPAAAAAGCARVDAAGRLPRRSPTGPPRGGCRVRRRPRLPGARGSSGARHVEVQVLADRHGRRDPPGRARLLGCSGGTRRSSRSRPSPAVDDELRAALGAAAAERSPPRPATRGAGTVEFLLGERRLAGGSWR